MTGEQLKLNGISRTKARNAEWVEGWCVWISGIAKGVQVSSDVLHAYDSTRPEHPNAWGALLNTAARRGLIKRVGYQPSMRPEAHGRIVSVWERV